MRNSGTGRGSAVAYARGKDRLAAGSALTPASCTHMSRWIFDTTPENRIARTSDVPAITYTRGRNELMTGWTLVLASCTHVPRRVFDALLDEVTQNQTDSDHLDATKIDFPDGHHIVSRDESLRTTTFVRNVHRERALACDSQSIRSKSVFWSCMFQMA